MNSWVYVSMPVPGGSGASENQDMQFGEVRFTRCKIFKTATTVSLMGQLCEDHCPGMIRCVVEIATSVHSVRSGKRLEMCIGCLGPRS